MIRFVDQDPTGKDGRKAYGAACETCRRAKVCCFLILFGQDTFQPKEVFRCHLRHETD